LIEKQRTLEEFATQLKLREKNLVEKEKHFCENNKGKVFDESNIPKKERDLREWENELKRVFEKQRADAEELDQERKQFDLLCKQHQLDMQENANKMRSLT